MKTFPRWALFSYLGITDVIHTLYWPSIRHVTGPSITVRIVKSRKRAKFKKTLKPISEYILIIFKPLRRFGWGLYDGNVDHLDVRLAPGFSSNIRNT